MKLRKEDGNIVLYFTSRVYIQSVNQWQINKIPPLNEITISLFGLYYFQDKFKDLYEIGFIVFGFGVILKINTFD